MYSDVTDHLLYILLATTSLGVLLKFFRNSISVCISPGCSGIICTNMFYMSVNKRLRGELVEAMVSYKLYISYVLAK